VDFTIMYRSLGAILAPLMLLSGLIAVIICLLSTLQPPPYRLRQAIIWSCVPLILSVIGAMVGILIVTLEGQPPMWINLGHVVLAGLFVSSVPALWSGLLHFYQTSKRQPAGQV
jgi:hypothetical protein